ncbi:PucR family transcriptional regulator [Geosporobacter ferrireducens]|uniref:PucR C-terminal helix-turn-helix domain-containing protein n=1 Tax=Geosporobacter ferrireducens TaxID=1424294 RepID=A0A1D8GED5_9FIRM|nr:helix-turn-helix domain-containing protein [Geosporobacter ferrireducens]AOT69264.1 hypothetical protein Gferi_06595 [Geosporobacter ferrireducens]
MESMKAVLQEIGRTVGKRILVIAQEKAYRYPPDAEFNIPLAALQENIEGNYKGYNIYRLSPEHPHTYVCIEEDSFHRDITVNLMLLMIAKVLQERKSLSQLVRGVLNGNVEDEQMFILEEKKSKLLPAHLILIDTLDQYNEEVMEITSNFTNVKLQLIYENRVLLLIEEGTIEDVCKDIRTNIMTELLTDCFIAIGGMLQVSEELRIHYVRCLEAMALKRRFKLPDGVYHYEKMDFYRVAGELNPELKESILQKVFSKKFEEALDHEIVTTIEEYFKNNLNLTDTAARLFIHRNTLLYRLDKIYRCSGYDLKNFSDCWLFQLAWIMRKEKVI